MKDHKKYFGGPIDPVLKDKVDEICEKQGYKIGRVVEILASLWVDMPEDLRHDLYRHQNQLSGWIDVVSNLIDQRIAQIGKNPESKSKTSKKQKQ